MPDPKFTSPTPSFHLDHFFTFRTPLLPFSTLTSWGQGLQAAYVWEDAEQISEAFAQDQELLRWRLRELVEHPVIREVLFVASPDLVDSLPRWIKEPKSEKGQRTEVALVRYFQRMCHRATPFGLFAGHSLGRMGDFTRLETLGRRSYKRSSRLDFDYLCGLVEELQKDPELRATLIYRPNSSLYRTAGHLRYLEARRKAGNRTLHLVALAEDPYLNTVLAGANSGAPLETLAHRLVSDEISFEEACTFIHDLIDNQVLISDLEPATTGPEPLAALVEALKKAKTTQSVATRLAQAGECLRGLDAGGLGQPEAHYLALAAELKELPVKVELSKLWQVDLFKPAPNATLGKTLQSDLVKAVALLFKLTPRGESDPFKQFKEAFHKRYKQHWVPLVEALDPECGIGFSGTNGLTLQGAPLLEDLPLELGGGQLLDTQGPKRREMWLLKRITDMRFQGEKVLRLSEEDVKELTEENDDPLPHSFACMAELAALSPEALNTHDYELFLRSVSGPSAAVILGRFCHGDEALCEEVRRHLRLEEACKPEAIFAEIVHVPYGRMGNVLARPLFREHEIPFLGVSGVAPGNRIPITDLYVGILDEQVILWSKSRNKEVVPRLSSAANYNYRATGIYRFLACLQGQGSNNWAGWSWGSLVRESRLPRVQYGHQILALEQWFLDDTALKQVKEAKSPSERFVALQRLRQMFQLPRLILLADGDAELPVDLENPLSTEALWSVIKKRPSIRIVEDFPGGEQLVAQSQEGKFTHELVLTFLSEPPPTLSAYTPPDLSNNLVQHAPGSSWLFAKLYSGLSTADHLLVHILAPLMLELRGSGEVDCWFFIRYSDPEPHLRLRLHGEPTVLWGSVLPRLHVALEPSLKDGRLWRFQLDTYEPEIERYGGFENIELAEQVFAVDSEAALELITLYAGDEGADARWRLAIRSIDDYYTCLNFPLENRKCMADKARERFAIELGLDKKQASRMLGDKFRTGRYFLETLLNSVPGTNHPLSAGIMVLDRRTERLRPLFTKMLELQAADKLTHPVENLLDSFIHMSTNRLLRSLPRAQEGVIYDFLTRIYESRMARMKKVQG